MSKKISFILRSLLFILIITAVCACVYSYALHYLIDYYSPARGDLFSNSMNISKLLPFPNGNTVVLGNFLQGDNILSQNELFIKAYDRGGRLIDMGSLETPKEYTCLSTVLDSDRFFLLYAPATESTSDAFLYEITSDARIVSVQTVRHPDESYASVGKRYFIANSEKGLYYAVLIDSTLFFFGPDHALCCTADLLPDVTVKQIGIAGDRFIVLGSIKEADTYNAFYCAYEADGTLVYPTRTMTDYTSVCTDFLRIPGDPEDAYYLAGYFFDSQSYMKSFGENAILSPENLAEIANESIERSVSGRAVHLASDYMLSPWCANFILKIGRDGEIEAHRSPMEATATSGASAVSILNTAGQPDSESRATLPILTYICSIAASEADESYRTEIYNVDSELSPSTSAQIILSSDISAYFTTMQDGSLVVYTAINGVNQYALHLYKDTTEYASEQNKLELCRTVTSGIESSVRYLPFLLIFILLAVTSRYSYIDYLVKRGEGF